MKRLLVGALLLSAIVACSGGNEDDTRVALVIDPDLSLESALGGDVGIAIGFDDCDELTGPATAEADGTVLATVEVPEPLIFGTGKRFLINIPGAAFDTRKFGLPADVPLVARAICDGVEVRSEVFNLRYVPTTSSFTLKVDVDRFWPAEQPGEILSCENTRLVRSNAESPLLSDADVEFACPLAELRGDPGERRYLVLDNGAIAAIDPGPIVAWTRQTVGSDFFLFDAALTNATQDLVVQYREALAGTVYVVVIDRNTGQNTTEIFPVVHKAIGTPTRDASGAISVLTWNRDGVELVYYIETFDENGQSLRLPIEAVRYSSESPYAEFSYDGSKLYVTATDGLGSHWIEAVNTASGEHTRLTEPSAPWVEVLGEIYFRLLVGSPDGFIWLDTETGAPLSQPFAPDSGGSFLRLRVELDGSVVMLADPVGANAANGFYVFAPDGTDVIRLHGTEQQYTWLAQGWDNGSLVGIQNSPLEVQVVPTRQTYSTLAETAVLTAPQ